MGPSETMVDVERDAIHRYRRYVPIRCVVFLHRLLSFREGLSVYQEKVQARVNYSGGVFTA